MMRRRFAWIALSCLIATLAATPAAAHRVSGAIYCDANNDGAIDVGDPPIASVFVRITSLDASPGTEYLTGSDVDGRYVMGLPQVTDRYQVEPVSLPATAQVVVPPAGVHVVTLITGTPQDTVDGLDFLVQQPCVPPETTTSTTLATTTTTTTLVTTTTPTSTTTSTTDVPPPSSTTSTTSVPPPPSTTSTSTTTTTTVTLVLAPCEPEQGTIKISSATLHGRNGTGALRLRAKLQGGDVAAIDPASVEVSIDLATATVPLGACALPPGTMTPEKGGGVGLPKSAAAPCSPIKSLVIKTSADRKNVTVYAPGVPIAGVRGQVVTLSMQLGGWCGTGTARVRRPPPPPSGCD
jgi:hypothetical protein